MTAEVKLVCRDVWKLFGPGAEKYINTPGEDHSLRSIQQRKLIPAVRDVNLEISHGEIFVIMGLSGSGKSTLLRCMSRLIEPSRGELLFEGVDLRTMSASAMLNLRRHKMGMVFQHFALLPHLTVLQNVAFPLDIQGQPKNTREQRALEVINLVGLAGREHNLPRELSGGQQQRVGIARSLAVEPELWFLDEPFSALDPLIRREMQDEFLRLQATLNKTIVFITHDFEEAIRLADRIAIMKDGAIIQVATPEALVLDPADDYVAAFTRHVPRDKVISVAAIMRAGSELKCHPDISVSAADKVAAVASRIYEAAQPLRVIDENGSPVGIVDREAVVRLLMSDSTE
ncbi:ABC transporter ATP-binding protein [Chromatiales bacterium (ex Bugula neritina AB1)]|nr:ABC transporter ATP-binding protein [Chromatiales bacterium (ex Bugula neritina AB1)]